ncbi:MAG: Mobile element protein [Candidatus Bipolaricaulis sibiricus]|uniref:Mutator family transposase n=1 Tax=Bipolaricaulis sibiricus TaxID=2501609 RepID=A0A410FVW7_BIPS1|nr:MAG: Mobile element protein [Candidatus Bipolaricaulis sibiricus]
MAAVVAVGVTRTGEREVLGFDVGPAESYGFWVAFLRGLASRGLFGVKLAISDAHVGLRQALSEALAGASWQRCRVHFMRNPLGLVPGGAQPLVGAWVRTIFALPDQDAAREQLELVAGSIDGKSPKAADLLREAGEDVIAHMAFPQAHWRRIHSTNVLERLHREVNRRCNVVGIFPNARSALRLIGAVQEEQGDEWLAVRRYFSLGSMAVLYGSSPEELEVLPLEVPKEVIAL